MRKKEIGQAFILVLILLGIGAVLVVPALRLTGTSLKSSQVVEGRTKGLYAADAAQEYILWKLLRDDLAGDLMESYNPETPDDPPSAHYDFYVCDVPVGVTVIMRAKTGEGGIVLATDDKIRPTKTVKCGDEEPPDEILNDWSGTITYTIRLDYLSDDDPTMGLDAIYDILPVGFPTVGANKANYVTDSSYLRVDGGEWRWIPNPFVDIDQNQYRLLWPADYNYQTRESAFSSHPEFYGIQNFDVRQVKEIKFQVEGPLPDNSVQCNWVVLKMDDGTNTLSGPQAPITVGTPANPGVCTEGALFEVTKHSNPEVIPPNEPVDIEYTISIKNIDGTVVHHIASVTDFLPFGFTYIDGSTSGITIEEPVEEPQTLNDVERWVLTWEPGVQLVAGETKTLTFWAHTDELDVSGSYYNEFIAIPSGVISPKIFENIGVQADAFMSNYSWNTGAVMVPAYDSSSEAEGVTINANMSLILGGITITSWQVD